MTDHKTELEKRNIIRLSNKQAKMVTKSCLQTALIQLLDKKELSDISVSELARRAGVSRTAFYSNYQTVDDVLTELIDQELKEVINSIWEAINREEDFFPPIIQKMKDNYDLYSLLMKANIEKTAFFQFRDYIKDSYPALDKKAYYMIIAAIGSLRSIIMEWFINGCEDSVALISEICDKSVEAVKTEIFPKLRES
jgi:AcrR family transcriptional regulator